MIILKQFDFTNVNVIFSPFSKHRRTNRECSAAVWFLFATCRRHFLIATFLHFSSNPNTNTMIILYPELSFLLRLHNICQRSFYKIFVKFRNSKKNVLKIVLIIVNINKDENKSLISNQFSLKNDSPSPTHFLENYFAEVKIKKLKTITNHF